MATKKYKTGEMLDLLGMNDTAENQDGYRVGYNHKGNLLMWTKNGTKPEVTDGNEFNLYFPYVKNDLWTIHHHYVKYDEAMEAHANSKKTIVYVHDEEMRYTFIHGSYGHFEKLASDGIELSELIKGDWLIIDKV